MKLVLATANPHKAEEIAAVLGTRFELIPRPANVADVDETGITLVDNARLKAVALTQATGMAALADDTGLFIDALDGDPGVYSARWSGEGCSYADNIAKALRELDGVPLEKRTARFVTVALVSMPDGRELAAEGEVRGHISLSARGSGGFGYDPVFVPDEGDGRTLAEMTAQEKNAISHRGRAMRALADLLDMAAP